MVHEIGHGAHTRLPLILLSCRVGTPPTLNSIQSILPQMQSITQPSSSSPHLARTHAASCIFICTRIEHNSHNPHSTHDRPSVRPATANQRDSHVLFFVCWCSPSSELSCPCVCVCGGGLLFANTLDARRRQFPRGAPPAPAARLFARV